MGVKFLCCKEVLSDFEKKKKKERNQKTIHNKIIHSKVKFAPLAIHPSPDWLRPPAMTQSARISGDRKWMNGWTIHPHVDGGSSDIC